MAVLSDPSRSATPVRWAVALLTPLAGVVLAYVLWWISDRLLYIGPLDRAKFGWLVVMPVWSITPVAAGYAWRTLDQRQSAVAAGVVALTLTAASAVLFWIAIAFPNCQFGAVRTPAEWIVPSVVVGIVIGGGFAASCLASTATLRRGHRLITLVVGGGSAFVLIFAALLVATLFIGIGTGTCQRPPLS
jgi:hypothetical protein